nr:KRAB-A domain-containing protein 2-like [Crassostrea gigas]
MDRIAADILGELPITAKGNRYILVVSDYFTKWTEAFAMPNMEAKTVPKIMVEEVFVRLGTPRIIHSNQGRQFESELFREVCRLFHIQKTRTTAYHPQSDGMVERFNRTLTSMLSAFVQETQTDWDEHIPYVMMAYRSAEHKSTQFTPNMLMLGRETTLPLDLQYEMPEHRKDETPNEWVWILRERLERAHNVVRQHTSIEDAMNRQKFKKGDNVFVYFPQRKRHEKFHPAEVLEKKTEDDKEWLEQDPEELIGEVSNESESSSSSIDSSEYEEVLEDSKGVEPGKDRQESQEIKKVEEKGGEENTYSSSLEKGRIIQKQTIPIPVFAPQRRVPLNLPDKNVSLNRFNFSSKC